MLLLLVRLLPHWLFLLLLLLVVLLQVLQLALIRPLRYGPLLLHRPHWLPLVHLPLAEPSPLNLLKAQPLIQPQPLIQSQALLPCSV